MSRLLPIWPNDESFGIGNDDAGVAMTTEAQVQRDSADGNDDHQHFDVKMVVAELPEERQQHDCERQHQAMDQAKTG